MNKLRYTMEVELSYPIGCVSRCQVLWDEAFPHAIELQFESGDHSITWTVDSDLLCTYTMGERNMWGDVIPPYTERDPGNTAMFAFGTTKENTCVIGFNASDLSNIKKMIDADISKCVANSSALELTPFHRYIDEGLNSLTA